MQITASTGVGLDKRRAYTIAQTAELLGVHKASVYRRIYEGKIKVLSGFGRLMISEQELAKFLSKSEIYLARKRHSTKRPAAV